jgi:hypothetical protein
MSARWYVVLLPGEYAETSDLFGPFQSLQRAEEVRDRWNQKHPDEMASVLPIMPATEMTSES